MVSYRFDHEAIDAPKSEQVSPDLRMGRSNELLLRFSLCASCRSRQFEGSTKLLRQLTGKNQLADVVKEGGNDANIAQLGW